MTFVVTTGMVGRSLAVMLITSGPLFIVFPDLSKGCSAAVSSE